MTAKQKLEKIKRLLIEADFIEASREEWDKVFVKMTLEEITQDMWEFYCFMCDVANVLDIHDVESEE